MIKRIKKIGRVIWHSPCVNTKNPNYDPLDKRAQDILKLIRSRQAMRPTAPTEPEQASPTADDWQRFKKKFVQEYGNEPVQATGMTHTDFFEYFRSGNRECDDEYDIRVRKSIADKRDNNKPSWQR